MQRYKNKSEIVVGHSIAFDNCGKFYRGLPFEIMVGEVVEIQDGDMIKVKFNIAGQDVEVELPFYLAQ